MAKKLIQVVYQVNDAALLKSQKAIQANEAAAKKADDAVKKFGNDSEKAGKQASQSFMNLGNVWKSLVAIGITAFFVNLGKKILDLGIKQEQLNIAFTTFLGSAEKAKKLLADLTKFAIVTPFTPDQVNNAAKALLAFGVQGREIIPTLKMLGDVSSGTGKDLTEMAIIFGQIRSTGRLMGQDLLQLINAGFNPLQIISEKTGKSVGTLKKEMEKGLITFDMVSDAFKTATSEGGLFFNLMEKQSQSIGGLLSTVEGNIDEILKNLFAASSGPVKAFVDQLVRLSEAFLEMSKSQQQIEDESFLQNITTGTERLKQIHAVVKDLAEAEKLFLFEVERQKKILQDRADALSKGAKASADFGEATQFAFEGEEAFTTLEEKAYKLQLDRIEALSQQAEAVTSYRKEVEDLAKSAENKKIAADFEAQAAAAKELADRLKDLERELSKIQERPIDEEGALEKGPGGFGVDLDRLEAYGDELMAEIDRQNDELLQQQHDADVAAIKAEEDKQRRIRDIRQQGFDFGLQLLGDFLMAQINANEMSFEREKGNFDQRITAAGDNARMRMEIEAERQKFEEEQDKKAEQFEIEKAKRDKDRQIKEMIVQGLLNSIRALGNPPVPNFLSAGLTAAFTAGQVGIARAVGYKEGGWIDGPGHETSDSIPIMASKNEFTVNAAAAKGAPLLLEAINERKIDDRILSKAQKQAIIRPDNSELLEELRKQRKSDYYEEGHFVNRVIQKKDNLKRHTRAKYGFK